MRAAVLRQPGLPLEVEDVELDAPRTGELAVRLEAAGVSHSDYHYAGSSDTSDAPGGVGRWWCRDDR